MNAYMRYVKVFSESKTKVFHLYNKKYVYTLIDGQWYTYIKGHGYKQSYYRVDYTERKDGRRIMDFKFFKSLRLAQQFARQKHTEYMNKKYGE